MDNFLAELRSHHFLSPALIERLVAVTKFKSLERKEFLLKAGHISRHIFFIDKGLLRSFYLQQDTEVCSSFMKERDIILPVESFFEQKPSLQFIQAIEDCQLRSIEYSELHFIFKEFPEFNFIIRKILEKHFVRSEQRLSAIRMKRSHERYNYLLDEEPELIQRVPSKFLASYLGVTDVTFSNVKSKN